MRRKRKSRRTGYEFLFKATESQFGDTEEEIALGLAKIHGVWRDDDWVYVSLWVRCVRFDTALEYALDKARGLANIQDVFRIDQDAVHIVNGKRVEDVTIREHVPHDHPICEWAD